MLFTVQQLIEGRPPPTVIGPEQTGLDALTLMIQHDYSQLPVVDGAARLVGLITGDSLLRAVNNLGVLPRDLRVKDALLDKPRTAGVETDVFDLIDALKATAAVLVVDAAQQLAGIVTDYDAMEFLRRRAEDIMLVEDIETSLKDHIRAAFSPGGQVDDQALADAITDVTNAQKERAEQFRKALAYYLSLAGDGAAKPDAALVTQVVERYYADKAQGKSLDDLTMAEYVNVLLHRSRHAYISHVFPVGAQAVRTLFDAVRPTRNALAHFRGGITPQQRDQLRYCAQWLARGTTPRASGAAQSRTAAGQAVPPSTGRSAVDAVAEPRAAAGEPVKIAATGAMRVADYGRLADALRAQPPDRAVVSMAFGEIEQLIGGSLPEAARMHRSWWSNDAATFAYAQAWVDAGWRVSADMIEEVATFTRRRA